MIIRGSFVIVRCEHSGVHCGLYDYRDGRSVVLLAARRVWRWRGANTLHELALTGASMTEFTRISEVVSEVELLDALEIIVCTEAAQKNLEASRWL